MTGGVTPSLLRKHAYSLQRVEREIRLPRWDADGFRVAFLSDFHLNGGDQTERSIRAAQIAYDAKPDVVILGGDFIEHDHPSYHRRMESFAKALRTSEIPTYSVLGNHDYWSLGADKVVDSLRRAGVHVMRNDVIEFKGVSLIGIDDAIDKRQRFDFFAKGRVSKSALAVLHEPDFVDEQPEHVSLQLSGHSHGGQCCLPGGVHLLTPKYGRRYPAGLFDVIPVPLYVSRGVGTTGPDLRSFCAPEVSILTLRSA